MSNKQISLKGIPIVTFQGNGSYTKTSYIERKGPLGLSNKDFSELSICLRLSLLYLRGRTSYFLSYATPQSADTLTGFIERTAFDKTYK